MKHFRETVVNRSLIVKPRLNSLAEMVMGKADEAGATEEERPELTQDWEEVISPSNIRQQIYQFPLRQAAPRRGEEGQHGLGGFSIEFFFQPVNYLHENGRDGVAV